MAESTTCKLCARLFDDDEELRDHMRSEHGESAEGVPEPRREEEMEEAKQPDR